MNARSVIVIASALVALAAPAAGTAAALPIGHATEVSSTDAPIAVLDEPTDATPGDPPPVEPGTAVEQAATTDNPMPESDPGIRPDPPTLVDFSVGGGFGIYRRLTVLWSRQATVYRHSRGSSLTGSFMISSSKLAQLYSALQQANFRSLRSRYTAGHRCKDCASFSITYAGRTVWMDEPALMSERIPQRLASVLRIVGLMLVSHPPTQLG